MRKSLLLGVGMTRQKRLLSLFGDTGSWVMNLKNLSIFPHFKLSRTLFENPCADDLNSIQLLKE